MRPGNRRDVLSRQRELAQLLHERHWTQRELAERLEISVRTLQRDFDDFEGALGEPVPRDRNGFYLKPGMHPVPSVELGVGEARTLLFAMRQVLHSTVEQDADAFGLLDKLATAFPGPIAEQVSLTRAQMGQRPVNRARQGHLSRLTSAWVRGELVLLGYRAVGRPANRSFCFETYVLEPSATTGATYVVGYNHTKGVTGTFKLDRVVSVEAHPPLCPFDRKAHARTGDAARREALERMGRSWSRISLGDPDEPEFEVVIDFYDEAARRVTEGPWHRERKIEPLPEGGTRLTLRLPTLFDFVPWLLSFGDQAVVREPRALRDQVTAAFRRGTANYAGD